MPLPATTNDAHATALQLAIWNVIYDSDNTVSSGEFATSGIYNSQANAYLTGSLGTTSTLQVGIMNSTQWLDFVVYGPVPEPGTYALMAAGLAAIGFVASRRSRGR